MRTVEQLLEQRISANHFDTERTIADAQISELVRLATLAPSAYNFQNWRFYAVRDSAAKNRLKNVAYGQQKVVDASVTFIVCGLRNAHRTLEQTLQSAVDAHILDRPLVNGWVKMATESHEGNEALQRDEAFRSASLAAMSLILAAESTGFVSGPMSGFDPEGICREFNLGPDEIPVILIAVGYPAPGNLPQKTRKAVNDVLTII